jgi:hypothetical protein
VPDDLDGRLVVLPAEHCYSKESGCSAEVAAKAILETRGNTPRRYRNTLVFLAADKVRLQDLDEALRKFLAWESILEEKETLSSGIHGEASFVGKARRSGARGFSSTSTWRSTSAVASQCGLPTWCASGHLIKAPPNAPAASRRQARSRAF